MSNKLSRLNLRETFFRRSFARELVGTIEFLICGGVWVWLWTSEYGQHLWVWMAVGLPLTFAYIFVGGYVRRRMGLIEPSTS